MANIFSKMGKSRLLTDIGQKSSIYTKIKVIFGQKFQQSKFI